MIHCFFRETHNLGIIFLIQFKVGNDGNAFLSRGFESRFFDDLFGKFRDSIFIRNINEHQICDRIFLASLNCYIKENNTDVMPLLIGRLISESLMYIIVSRIQ